MASRSILALTDAAEEARFRHLAAGWSLGIAEIEVERAMFKSPRLVLAAIRNMVAARRRLARATKAYDRAVDALSAAKRASRRKVTGR